MPFRGESAMLPVLLKGDIDMGTVAVVTLRGQNFRPLLIFAGARHPALPDVPTERELGVATSVPPGHQGLFAPKGLRADIRASAGARLRRMRSAANVVQSGIDNAATPHLCFAAAHCGAEVPTTGSRASSFAVWASRLIERLGLSTAAACGRTINFRPPGVVRAGFSGAAAMAISLKVNGVTRSVPAEPDTPLLYVLRNDFELNGAKYGCGLAQCGACTVLVDGKAVRSCVTPISALANREITTIEALGTLEKPHPLQRAFIDEQAAQCGYCTSGMIMSAKELIDRQPRPSEQDVAAALAGNLCRCGGYNRIIRAVMRAAQANGRT